MESVTESLENLWSLEEFQFKSLIELLVFTTCVHVCMCLCRAVCVSACLPLSACLPTCPSVCLLACLLSESEISTSALATCWVTGYSHFCMNLEHWPHVLPIYMTARTIVNLFHSIHNANMQEYVQVYKYTVV